MIAGDCISTSPLSSTSEGTRRCGLTARYSGVCCLPPSLVRWIGNLLGREALEIERDAHAIGGGRAEIGVVFHAISRRKDERIALLAAEQGDERRGY